MPQAISEVELPDLSYVFGKNPTEGTAHIAAILVPPSRRETVCDILRKARIQTSLHYPPIHAFSAFAVSSDHEGQVVEVSLPMTEKFANRVITLPIHPGLSSDDVAIITDTLIKALEIEFA